MTDPGATAPDPATAPKRPRRRRRWRLTIRILVFVPLALVLVALLLARSPMVRNGIAEQLVELTGADVRMRKAKFDVTGRIIARDLVLTVPGLNGPAAEIVTARKVEIDLDWSGVFSWSGIGTPRPTAIRLYNPVFRLSQSFDDGSLNFGGLAKRGGTGGGAGSGGSGRMGTTPTIDIFDGRIEFAEHSARLERFELLNAIQVAGSMIAERDGSYIVKMQEIGRVSPPRGVPATFPRGMILAGNIHLARAEASLKLLNLPLEAWPPEAVPTAFRDLWRRLSIQGRIRETVFSFDRASGVRLSVVPEDVSMDILIPAERGGDMPGDLSLAHVNGRIELSRAGLHAELEGVFEDQTSPARVVLKTSGTSLDSALTCEIAADGLTVAQNPGFLPYVPAAAREHFEFFSGPTGEVDARVTIARGPPVNGVAAPIVVTDGRLVVRNGTAAFHKFPYPFHSMEGRAVFDDQRINILDMTGIGPTGARLRASAQISPLTDDAEANVSVSVTGVPVDEHLRKAMPGERARIFEVLFNEERYATLLGAGLVRIPAAGGDAASAPDEVPEFVFGGLADVDVTVHRPLGHGVDWKTDIVVRFAEAGMVPEPFPFPIKARDVELKITDDDAVLTRGTFAGLRGGRAELAAHIVLRENGEHVIKPSVRIDAFGVPVDDRLIHAVPEDRDRAEAEQTVSAKAILRRLAIEGNVDCTAIIEDDGRGEGEVDYDVVVKMAGLEARPRVDGGDAESGEVRVTGVSGSVRVTPVQVRVESLVGTLVERSLGDGEEGTCGAFTLDLAAELIPPEDDEGSTRSGPLTARAKLRDLSLGAPLEPLLAVFNDDAAELVARTRVRREPEGRVDAALRIDIADQVASPRVSVAFSALRDVSFRALQGRLELVDAQGVATLGDEPRRENDGHRHSARVGFDRFAAGLVYDGAPAGALRLQGGFLFDPDAAEGTPLETLVSAADMRVELRDGKLESPFVVDMLAEGLEPATVDRFAALEPEGMFDAHIDLSGEPAVASGLIGPRSLSFVRLGRRVSLSAMHGHVQFSTIPPAREGEERSIAGTIEALGCIAPDWSATADGQWSFVPGRGARAALVLSVQGERVTDDLLALLPSDIGEGARALGLKIEHGFSMPDANLEVAVEEDDPAGERTGVLFDGALRFSGGGVDLGVTISEAEGEVFVRAEQRPGSPADVEVQARMPRFEVLGLEMTDGRVELSTVEESGRDGSPHTAVSISHASAACHDGRIWATAQIGPPATDGGGREFKVDVLGAGVQLAPVLDELGSEHEAGADLAAGETDRTRGMVDAWMTVSGRVGDPAGRVGRGAVRVANGDVLRLPIMLPLVQMSNLMLPKSDRFDYLQAEFLLRGSTAEFERIAVLSDSVSLMGAGTVTLPELALDMRFNSRSNQRVPLLSDLYEAVRDEIVSTRVRGTVAVPEVRSESFSTARTVLGMLLDPSHERAGEIVRDRAARREQSRASRAAEATRPLPPTTMPMGSPGSDG